MTRKTGWMWMAALLTFGGIGSSALAAAKTMTGKVLSASDKSLQVQGATKDAPALTFVVTDSNPGLKSTVSGLKADDTVNVTYETNAMGARTLVSVEKK